MNVKSAMTSLNPQFALFIESQGPASVAKPFIRWVGGKSRLMSRILPHVPSKFENYFEPFLGSGAVFFSCSDRVRQIAYLSDMNSNLISAYRAVRDCPQELAPLLERYVNEDSEDTYYKVRATSPEGLLETAARFLYLNGVAWNHLWRENSKTGAMNAPWGNRKYKGIPGHELLLISQVLAKADLNSLDFRESLKNVSTGDFVYLDPPYLPIFSRPETEKEPTSKFNKYTAKAFEYADLLDLAKICDQLTDQGVNWILSNRDTESVCDLFPRAEKIRFTVHRSLSAQSRREVEAKKSPEVLIIGR